ncbi:uncharacterized protein LOC123313396 isoform X2 [Coccinella septempunctata]|nr:uncharacterized protein LOC123313396 isoform X2 [Coccinella septempunctata]
MEKIGFVQFFILESIILMAGDNCSTKISPTVRRAKTEAVNCIGDLHVSGSFCESVAEDWLRCLKPLGKKIEECNKNVILKGAIEASIETAITQAKFICNIETSHLLELANPCFLKSLESEEPCINRFVIDVQSVFLVEKKLTDEFCRASSELERCLTGTIESNCPNNITINTVRGIYKATVEPCDLKKKKL